VVDRVLLTADRNNVEECIDLAIEHDLGIEVMIFAYPDILDGNWKHTLATYRGILRPVPGPITLHGPFMDLVGGSPDERINQVCYQRYQHGIHIAAELDAELIVYHANFIGSLHNTVYREGWHKRNVEFWRSLAEYADANNMTIAMENMWEFEPSIIADLLREIDHPRLRACLDVGHAHLFGDDEFTLQNWIDTMEPWLIHTHMNNNNGKIDEHYGFDWEDGVLDYGEILKQIRALKKPPNIVLEMYHVEDMRKSLNHLEIGQSDPEIA
jgi:sugar phosphate isomerase/epimerase